MEKFLFETGNILFILLSAYWLILAFWVPFVMDWISKTNWSFRKQFIVGLIPSIIAVVFTCVAFIFQINYDIKKLDRLGKITHSHFSEIDKTFYSMNKTLDKRFSEIK